MNSRGVRLIDVLLSHPHFDTMQPFESMESQIKQQEFLQIVWAKESIRYNGIY